ncbi:MAG: transaldolase, partial [Candidatus Zixiibacteriota bacterium]
MKQGSLQIKIGAVDAAYKRALKKGAKASVVQRIMAREAGVYTSDRKLKKLIAGRLGWVDSATRMKRHISAIEKFGKSVFADRIKHVVLMGMGGSSLCPELFKLVHGKHPRLKSFNVIDSTDPAAIRSLTRKIEPKRTLFIVASKSGGTVETRSQEAYFIGVLKKLGVKNIGRHFAVITDSGSALQEFARKHKYRKVFVNPSDIGGRYSALSLFGLVPGFFAGVDIRAFIDDAVAMQKLLVEREGEANPALAIGALLYAATKEGRDKLTFIASKKTAPLVPWIEQLVAESTGKKKKGVIPIDNEPVGKAAQYTKDRMFVFLRMTGEKAPDYKKLKAALGAKQFPIVEISLGSAAELGRQFLLWEAITAVVGWYLGINPFDEPNVTESKNNTKAILAAFERSGKFPQQVPHSSWGKLSLVGYD